MKRYPIKGIIIVAIVLAGIAGFMTAYGKIEDVKSPVSSLSSTHLYPAKVFSKPMLVASEEVKIPVNARDVSNVGSLEFQIVYDSIVLEATEVETGALAANAMMESSVENPGRVWIGMIDANGMNGKGSLVIVSFRVVGEGEMSSPLTLENIAAHDAETLFEIATESSPGIFSIENSTFTPPIIIFIKQK